MRKQLTEVVDSTKVDLMVINYSCKDSSILKGIGKHDKEVRWTIQAGPGAKPLEITLHVESLPGLKPKVSLHSQREGGRQEKLWPNDSSSKSALREDFRQKWPFRALAPCINERGVWEIRPQAGGFSDWYPGTVTKQREDGLFEALVAVPDGYGSFRELNFSAVNRNDIREVVSKKPLIVPENFMTLIVPREKPLAATVTVNDQKDNPMWNYFARETPKMKMDPVTFRVSKDRKTVTSNIGPGFLNHFIHNAPRAKSSQPQRLKHSWVVQIGPTEPHVITIEKKWTVSKIITVSIDGEPLIESAGENIGCPDNYQCKFKFLGERQFVFEIHETNADGNPLDSKAVVQQRQRFEYECVIAMPDERSLDSAQLWVHACNFNELPSHQDVRREEGLSTTPEALKMSYGLTVPYKVNVNAPQGLSALMASQAQALPQVGGLFTMCCNGGHDTTSEAVLEK